MPVQKTQVIYNHSLLPFLSFLIYESLTQPVNIMFDGSHMLQLEHKTWGQFNCIFTLKWTTVSWEATDIEG